MKNDTTKTKEYWEALDVQTFGLTQDLFVPIAAAGIDAIEVYVGTIKQSIPGRKRPINAVVVEAQPPDRNPLQNTSAASRPWVNTRSQPSTQRSFATAPSWKCPTGSKLPALSNSFSFRVPKAARPYLHPAF